MALKDLKAGEVLLAEGDVPQRAYRIVEGSVEMSRDVDGMSMPTAVHDRGALIGAEEMLDGRPMEDTAQALGTLKVEAVSMEQAAQLLGRAPSAKKAEKPKRQESKAVATSSEVKPSRALVALSASAKKDYVSEEDTAANVLKPGLLRRILRPDFADIYDRLDIRVAPLDGDDGEQASAHLISELGQRRGLKARGMNAKVELDLSDGDPVSAMQSLKKAARRWLADNGGDAIVWGAVTPDGQFMHLRFFVKNAKPVDPYRMGDGWTLLVLPMPLDNAAAHKLHAALLATVRTKAAGKLLTVRRDLDVLITDARDHLLGDIPNLDALARAEDHATVARIFANATLHKKRADDARQAVELFDSALEVFSAESTPLEWAFAKRDRAMLGQFIAERANDSSALAGSVVDFEDALSIIGPSLFANDWALINDRLGLALYRLDFDNGDTETLEHAMQAFKNALSVYDKQKAPNEWAEAMGHFGQLALILGREKRSAPALLKAVEACNAVVSVRDRKGMPLHWASAQNNLGSALFLYGRVASDRDALEGARTAFETARGVYLEKGAERLAGVAAKNLRHVEKALNRRVGAKRPPDLPWEEHSDGPPVLPWELDADAERATRARTLNSNDDVWLDERLR